MKLLSRDPGRAAFPARLPMKHTMRLALYALLSEDPNPQPGEEES